jgi:hypothetical protein
MKKRILPTDRNNLAEGKDEAFSSRYWQETAPDVALVTAALSRLMRGEKFVDLFEAFYRSLYTPEGEQPHPADEAIFNRITHVVGSLCEPTMNSLRLDRRTQILYVLRVSLFSLEGLAEIDDVATAAENDAVDNALHKWRGPDVN